MLIISENSACFKRVQPALPPVGAANELIKSGGSVLTTALELILRMKIQNVVENTAHPTTQRSDEARNCVQSEASSSLLEHRVVKK